jgi:hypothetical protein
MPVVFFISRMARQARLEAVAKRPKSFRPAFFETGAGAWTRDSRIRPVGNRGLKTGRIWIDGPLALASTSLTFGQIQILESAGSRERRLLVLQFFRDHGLGRSPAVGHDGRDDCLRGTALTQACCRSRLAHVLGYARIFVHRQADHAYIGHFGVNNPGSLDSVHSRHADVHKHHVRIC